MVYAVSDIHGAYEKYITLLEKIRFSPDDTLYVLGDVLDRGDGPIRILRDMMGRDNVFAVLGNHEAVALEMLRRLNVEITAENCDTHMDAELMAHLLDWQMDGGASTLREFGQLSREERMDVLDYLADLPLYEAVDVGRRTFVMVHAGLGNFDENRPLRTYRADEVILGRQDLTKPYFADPDTYVITGHTPTQAITGRAEVHFAGNTVCIDCGAAFGGRLACLCLDTMETIYID